MRYLIWPSVVLLGCVVVGFLIAYLGFGRYTIRHFGTRKFLTWTKCPNCTEGTQWLDEDGHWGPIPYHVRLVRHGHPYFEPPQANVRTCPHCQLGGWWHDKERPDG